MKLTAENVRTVFMDCLFKKGEDTSNHVKGEGVLRDFGFHPQRLASHKQEIKEMLSELPDPFQRDKGGGWSFLNACMDRNDHQWGEHQSIEQLLALGTATQQAKILMPRSMWPMFPGGMPYFGVGEYETTQAVLD